MIYINILNFTYLINLFYIRLNHERESIRHIYGILCGDFSTKTDTKFKNLNLFFKHHKCNLNQDI